MICLALKLSDVVFTMFTLPINVKMPTIVGILTFMSRINFMLSSAENEKKILILEPGLHISHNSSLVTICFHFLLTFFAI